MSLHAAQSLHWWLYFANFGETYEVTIENIAMYILSLVSLDMQCAFKLGMEKLWCNSRLQLLVSLAATAKSTNWTSFEEVVGFEAMKLWGTLNEHSFFSLFKLIKKTLRTRAHWRPFSLWENSKVKIYIYFLIDVLLQSCFFLWSRTYICTMLSDYLNRPVPCNKFTGPIFYYSISKCHLFNFSFFPPFFPLLIWIFSRNLNVISKRWLLFRNLHLVWRNLYVFISKCRLILRSTIVELFYWYLGLDP